MTCYFSYTKPPHVGPPGVGSKRSREGRVGSEPSLSDLKSILQKPKSVPPQDATAAEYPPKVSAEGIWLPPAEIVEPQRTRTQVLVIGAGMAGLAAARTLINSGYEVLVLEARDRVGGRIWQTDALGVPVDVGAAWGTGGQVDPALERIIDRNGQTGEVPAVVYDQSGRRLTEAERQWLSELREEFIAYVKECQRRGVDLSFQDAEAEFGELKHLDAWQRSALRYVVRTFIEHEWAGSHEESSLLEYDQVFHGLRDGYGRSQGQESLIESLARDVPIRTNCEVRRINYAETHVDVWTTAGMFSAPLVLITVPLGVLKSEKILFRPTLPESKRSAVAGLRMGVFNKVFVRFDRVFWDEHCDRIGVLGNTFGDWPEIVPLQEILGEPVLMAFSAGRSALCNEAMAVEDVVSSLMKSLRKIYGPDVPDPVAQYVSRWHADPFSLGSYSFVPTGSVNTLRADLAAPVAGRLFFAGEATSQSFASTVHGAYLSGVRAAFDIRARQAAVPQGQLQKA